MTKTLVRILAVIALLVLLALVVPSSIPMAMCEEAIGCAGAWIA